MARNKKHKLGAVPVKDRTLTNCVHESLVDENVLSFRAIQDKLVNIYAKKNHDYGDSFNQGCDELGVGYAFSRIFDKTKRFQTLAKGIMNNNLSIEVQDETVEDTIMDLANYCVMYLAWRDKHNICIGEAEAKEHTIQTGYVGKPVSISNDNINTRYNIGCDPAISSTGELESNTDNNNNQESVEEYSKIAEELRNKTSKLILEQTGYTCTDEVIDVYGICLYKDENDYVYMKTINDEFVNVTFKHSLVKVVPNK